MPPYIIGGRVLPDCLVKMSKQQDLVCVWFDIVGHISGCFIYLSFDSQHISCLSVASCKIMQDEPLFGVSLFLFHKKTE